MYVCVKGLSLEDWSQFQLNAQLTAKSLIQVLAEITPNSITKI